MTRIYARTNTSTQATATPSQNKSTVSQVQSKSAGVPHELASLERATHLAHNFGDLALGADKPATEPAKPMLIQRKLMIGQPDDRYEQEADRVAAAVVRQINAHTGQQVGVHAGWRQGALEAAEKIHRKPVQQQEDIEEDTATPIAVSINRARGSGHRLSDSIRKPMERAIGSDFSRVAIHTDIQSEQLNCLLQSRAFTTGQDIFFRQGAYNPGSEAGQRLIAHELTHTLQQTNGQIQRLIDKEGLIARVGKGKRTLISGRKQEAAYQKILQSLDTYHSFLGSRIGMNSTSKSGFRSKVNGELNNVLNVCNQFLQQSHNADDMRIAQVRGILAGIEAERRAVEIILDNYAAYQGETYEDAIQSSLLTRMTTLNTKFSQLESEETSVKKNVDAIYDLPDLTKDETRTVAGPLVERGDQIKAKMALGRQEEVNILDQNPALLEKTDLAQLNKTFSDAGYLSKTEDQHQVQPKISRLRASAEMRSKLKKIIDSQIILIATKIADLEKVRQPGTTAARFLINDFVVLVEPEQEIAQMLAQMAQDLRTAEDREEPWMDKALLDSKARVQELYLYYAKIHPNLATVPPELSKSPIIKGWMKEILKSKLTNEHNTITQELAKVDTAFTTINNEIRQGKALQDLSGQLQSLKNATIASNEYKTTLGILEKISKTIPQARLSSLNETGGQLTPSQKMWRNHHQKDIVKETSSFLKQIGGSESGLFKLPEGENLTVNDVPDRENSSVPPVLSMTAPEKLDAKQKDFLAGISEQTDAEKVYERGFITRYKDNPEHFRRMMQFGKVLWTLDIDNILSIGSERGGNKHAVVAGGKDVWAAGEARIKRVGDVLAERGKFTEEQLSLVTNIDEIQQKITKYTASGAQQLGLSEKDFEISIEQLRKEIEEIENEIGGKEKVLEIRETVDSTKEELTKETQTVFLDFSSGHYAPKEAWRKANDAWEQVGFKVEWNRFSQFV